METLSRSQLPAHCIVVRQTAWLFLAEALHRGAIVAQLHDELPELIDFVNDWQLRQAGPVYLQVGISQQFEPLSYERACALARAESATT